MSIKYKKQRKVKRLDNTNSKFYVYALFWANHDQDTEIVKENIFYVGKAKNKEFPCLRRENKHMEEAYAKSHKHFHKSRKIRQLEQNGKHIMSTILEEFDDELSAYEGELKWYKKIKKWGNDLTNMIDCGIDAVGSGENHPSYDFKIREKSEEIKNLYENKMWSLAKISKHFQKSSKIIFIAFLDR